MALTYDLSKISDFEELNTDNEWAVTEAVIFSGMFIGLGRISARNWRDFARRVMVWEQCFGALLNSNGNPRPLTPADIERRIGLSMNVVDISGAAFRAKLVERMNEEADRKIKSYESEKANG